MIIELSLLIISLFFLTIYFIHLPSVRLHQCGYPKHQQYSVLNSHWSGVMHSCESLAMGGVKWIGILWMRSTHFLATETSFQFPGSFLEHFSKTVVFSMASRKSCFLFYFHSHSWIFYGAWFSVQQNRLSHRVVQPFIESPN